MKTWFNRFIIAILALASHATLHTNVFAGGWISSGGETFNNAHNPWFIHNTARVEYCIEVNESTISGTRTGLQRTVAAAIQYWKSQFSEARLPSAWSIRVATQDFVEVPCSGAETLRFKFGYETLNQKERDFFGDAQKFVAATVRTDYDEVQLRGRGFIFVASDLGPHAYYNNGGELVSAAWRDEKLLLHVLVHEMGHVLGIPHVGSGIMSEVFMEQVLHRKFSWLFSTLTQVEPFFNPPSTLSDCTVGEARRRWFQLPVKYRCLNFKHAPTHFDGTIEVWGGNNSGDYDAQMGRFTTDPISTATDKQARPVVIVRLGPLQSVVNPLETDGTGFVAGAALWDYGLSGQYYPATAGSVTSQPIYMRVTPSSLHILGLANGEIRPILSYQSVLGDWLVAPN